MEEKKNIKKKRRIVNGVSANTLVIPLLVVLAFLFNLIVYAIYDVNRATSELSGMMGRYGSYQKEATEMMSGASLMSETTSTFVQNPKLPDGSLSIGPMKAYAKELGVKRRGPDIVDKFRTYDVSNKVLTYIMTASQHAEYLKNAQLHAISLIVSVYGFPPIPDLEAIPLVELTDEEKAMSPESRIIAAEHIISSSEYGSNKSYLNENITKANQTLQEEFETLSKKREEHIFAMRTLLWVVTFLIIIILIVAFAMFYRWLIFPLRAYAKMITSDESLEKKGGIKELRLVAAAYNELLHRREKLETFLRTEAETDSLTGMPNRYSFDKYALDLGDYDGPLAIMLFDVNFLKKVNDTKGHLAGDKLICTSGNCICERFSNGNEANCFRIGGDEFAAIVRNCTEDEVKSMLNHFDHALRRENISVSVGYAYAEKTDENSFKLLMNQADKHMYDQKKHIHELQTD